MTTVWQTMSPGVAVERAGTLTLTQECELYFAFKRKRLTAASQRSYVATLREFTGFFAGRPLAAFEPPEGTSVVEAFLTLRWGDKAARTYNKNFATLHDFFKWEVIRGRMTRDPMASLERARPRAVRRLTFSEEECERILAANPGPRDQIALRLLLHYGLRKGALRNVRLEHFDRDAHRLTIFTKGQKILTIPLPDPALWQLLSQIREPGHHYLIPKQQHRHRRSPARALFAEADELLGQLAETVAAIEDPQCEAEVARLHAGLDELLRRLALAVEASSVHVRSEPAQQAGEHGTHLWWYRCLARAGIVPRGTRSGRKIHSARHTAGQRVVDRTGNLKAAQALLGHATIGTTGDIYTSWGVGQLETTMRDVLAASLDEDLRARASRAASTHAGAVP